MFSGIWQVEGTHISGIHTFYDSIGNEIGMGLDTTIVSTDMLLISQQGDTDTLIIDGLVKSFNANFRTIVQGTVQNDTINIHYDLSSPGTSNNYIRGQIWLQSDNIFLDYDWDTSDIWSTDGLPREGSVISSGSKVF